MTKTELQAELKEKVKEGVKPSDLKKLKRSKSADDIPSSPAQSVPLKKSQSQLEIPLQPSLKEQITNLKEQVQFHAETAQGYLQSLQTSQAKVSELEKQLRTKVLSEAKDNPPNALLSEQLKVKQKEIESLRKQLEEKSLELQSLKKTKEALLDDNLSLKHQSLKDWWQQYQQTQQLQQELKENVDYASDELISQDQTISTLRSENLKLKQTNQSLQKDLALTEKLAQLRKTPLPSPINSPWLTYALTFCLIGITFWLTIR